MKFNCTSLTTLTINKSSNTYVFNVFNVFNVFTKCCSQLRECIFNYHKQTVFCEMAKFAYNKLSNVLDIARYYDNNVLTINLVIY